VNCMAIVQVRSWQPNHRENLVCLAPRRVAVGSEVIAEDGERDVLGYVVRSRRNQNCPASDRFIIEVIPVPDVNDDTMWEQAYGLGAPHVDGGAG
jgi:hypothetical protein